YGLPSKRRGPMPNVSLQVAYLRESEALSFSDIGLKLGISKQAAHAHWKRYQKARSNADMTGAVYHKHRGTLRPDMAAEVDRLYEQVKVADSNLLKIMGLSRLCLSSEALSVIDELSEKIDAADQLTADGAKERGLLLDKFTGKLIMVGKNELNL